MTAFVREAAVPSQSPGAALRSRVARRPWLIGIALLFVLQMPLIARAQADGKLSGQVINGTVGGGSVAGLEVTLRTFQGTQEGSSLTATTDAQGAFAFENLETDPDWVYLVQVPYESVLYSAGMASFDSSTHERTVQVPVYETTTDYTGMGVERAHIFCAVSGTSLSVSELYVFANQTDRTYIGTEMAGDVRAVSRFSLPPGSHDLTFEDGSLGGRFRATEGGFVDVEPLWPGSTSVLFGYVVDCVDGVCDLGREITHPIANLNVLMADQGATIDSASLAFAGTQQAEGQAYLNYAGHGFTPGSHLDLVVHLPGSVPAQRPASAAPSAGANASSLPWIILGSVLAVLALAYPFWQQRVRALAVKESRPDAPVPGGKDAGPRQGKK
jgi:hypothetical protein